MFRHQGGNWCARQDFKPTPPASQRGGCGFFDFPLPKRTSMNPVKTARYATQDSAGHYGSTYFLSPGNCRKPVENYCVLQVENCLREQGPLQQIRRRRIGPGSDPPPMEDASMILNNRHQGSHCTGVSGRRILEKGHVSRGQPPTGGPSKASGTPAMGNSGSPELWTNYFSTRASRTG